MQATTVQPAPAAPATPAVPRAPSVPSTVTFTGVDGVTQVLPIPLTRRDVADLRDRREELSNQLQSAAGRRNRLSEQISSAPAGPSRTGLEERLTMLDKRIIQLESDIASTGRQLSAAPQGMLATSSAGGSVNDIPENVRDVVMVFTFFIFFPLAMVFARNLWKRGNRISSAPALPADAAQRLERVEQGVEAIAIEIERVSEGQRFVTRLLSEGKQPDLRIGQTAVAEAEARR